MRTRNWVILVLVAATVGGALIVGWPLPLTAHLPGPKEVKGAPGEQAGASARVVRGIERDMTALRLEVAALRHEAMPADTVSPDAPENRAVEEPDPIDLSPEEQEELMIESTMQTNQNRLDSEVADAAWAGDQETRIASAFSSVKHSKLSQVTCKATICRTRVEHEGEEGREAFLQSSILGTPPFDTSAFFMPTPDGVGTLIYSSRTGHSLPRVER